MECDIVKVLRKTFYRYDIKLQGCWGLIYSEQRAQQWAGGSSTAADTSDFFYALNNLVSVEELILKWRLIDTCALEESNNWMK